MTEFWNTNQPQYNAKTIREYYYIAGMLEGMNLIVTPATEDIIHRLTLRLSEAKQIEDPDVPRMQALFLLKSADFCITRNLALPIEKDRFKNIVVIEPLDVQIANLTSLCTCLVKPECSTIKNDFRSINVFSGEAERLRRLLGTKEAISLLAHTPKELANLITKEYGIPVGVTSQWFEMKVRIWFGMAEIINNSDKLKALKIE